MTDAFEQRDCILCGRCLEVCPLFAATGREELSPRGKSFLISQALEQGKLVDPKAARKLLGLCLGCGRCAKACPQGRDLPTGLCRLKAEQPGWQAWVWQAWISGAKTIWPWLGSCTAALPGRLDSRPLAAGLKAMAFRPFYPAAIRRISAKSVLPGPAVLFPGCMARFAKPWWLGSALKLLDGLSGLLSMPDWACCGFTLGQAGLTRAQQDKRSRNVQLWQSLGRPLILTICATCTAGLRGYTEAAALFRDEAEKAEWGQAVRPLSGLLDPGDVARQNDSPILYHRPCHALLPDFDQAWLQGVFGPSLRTRPDRNSCCGLGGVMRLSAPELSVLVAADYWTRLGVQGQQRVVTGCSGCVTQLTASAPQGVAVMHWLDLFAL